MGTIRLNNEARNRIIAAIQSEVEEIRCAELNVAVNAQQASVESFALCDMLSRWPDFNEEMKILKKHDGGERTSTVYFACVKQDGTQGRHFKVTFTDQIYMPSNYGRILTQEDGKLDKAHQQLSKTRKNRRDFIDDTMRPYRSLIKGLSTFRQVTEELPEFLNREDEFFRGHNLPATLTEADRRAMRRDIEERAIARSLNK